MEDDILSREARKRLRGVTLRQLMYLVELARTENFRKAAEALSVTQPTLSQQIKQLEETLGFALLQREKRGFALTEAGALMVARATRALDVLGSGIDRLLLDLEEPVLRIGLPAYLSYPFITDFVLQFRKRHPSVFPHFVELPAAVMAEQLMAEKIDLAFLSNPTPTRFPPTIREKPVWRSRYNLCLSKNHPAASKGVLTHQDCQDMDFILLPREVHAPHYEHQLGSLKSLADAPSILQTDVVNAQAQIELAKAGLGACLICQGTVQLADDVVLRPTDPPLAYSEISAFWHSRNINPLLNRFVTMLDDLVQGQPLEPEQ
ncbi:LysR family transcriptional regulator (plasmid) [Phaeobacter sp. BS23]|uniref:LysR family transcriptional regulator n=1 Tax=Phaeobacter sp. BS23 TaxID=2907239 RepID=UPI003703A61F